MLICLLVFIPIKETKSQQKGKALNLNAQVQAISEEGVFRDMEYFNWGSSIIKGEDDKYHLFYSRWPRSSQFSGWLTRSEVAHAIADHPAGPYTYQETVLEGRGLGKGYWDEITAHNPKIKYLNGKYYLYYISTHSQPKNFSEQELQETVAVGYGHHDWKLLRENQRTGVAVAEALNGPWKRLDEAIIEPTGPISTLTVNPAITQGPDGLYYLIVKGDKPNEERFIRNQAIAIASSPIGPFEIQDKAVIDDLDTEDVSMWYSETDKKFYAVFHAHHFIGLMSSNNGTDWEKAKSYKITDKKLLKQDGTYIHPDRMERPFVYVENDIPKVLCLAVKKGNDSFTVFISLEEID